MARVRALGYSQFKELDPKIRIKQLKPSFSRAMLHSTRNPPAGVNLAIFQFHLSTPPPSSTGKTKPEPNHTYPNKSFIIKTNSKGGPLAGGFRAICVSGRTTTNANTTNDNPGSTGPKYKGGQWERTLVQVKLYLGEDEGAIGIRRKGGRTTIRRDDNPRRGVRRQSEKTPSRGFLRPRGLEFCSFVLCSLFWPSILNLLFIRLLLTSSSLRRHAPRDMFCSM
jgi:hypothetical protein